MTDAELSGGAAPAPASPNAPPAPRSTTRPADRVAAVALIAVAGLLRALPWPSVFTADGIRLVGPDAHYHLRRIQWSVENFPAVLTRDAYVRFPDGGQPIWTPTLDWGIAALARVFVGPGDPAGVETLAVWVPPVLGALTVAVVWWTAHRFFGRGAGLVAGGTLAVLPAHVSWSQVGFVDHHAAVALLAAVLLAATLGWMQDDGSRARAAGLGLCMGAALLVWPGCLLHVSVVQGCLLARTAAAGDADRASDRSGDAAIAHGAAFLLVTPLALAGSWTAWGPLSPVVLSAFQPLWLGLPALAFGACAIAWRLRPERGANAAARRATLLAALGVPALAALAVPDLRAGVDQAARWLMRDEAFQAVVSESLPLLADAQGWSVQRAHAQLTPLFWITPVAILALAARGRRSAPHAVVAFFCTVLLGATLAQYRFVNSFSVLYAVALGAGFELARAVLWRRPRTLRWATGSAAVAVALVLLAPVARSQLRALGSAGRSLAGEAVRPDERVTHHGELLAAARWLGEHSPPTGGWLDAGTQPAYGVLTAWGDGHVVRYVARRPVVQDNFGDDVGRERFDEAERYFSASSETEALRTAEALRARYVLVRGSGSGHAPEPYAADSMLVRLYRLRGAAGSLRRDRGQEPFYVPALDRHRLVYESVDARGEEGGRYKLFEIVPGAVVSGRAEPDALVEARLALREPGDHGRRFEYRQHTRADGRGDWSLRLPYPTGPFESRYTAEGPYRIVSGTRTRPLLVPEQAIQSGTRLEGPDLGV